MSLRIVLSVIGVYVLMEILRATDKEIPPAVANSVAFCVGAFPMIVWGMLSTLMKKYSGIGGVLPTMTRGIALGELDGITVWHETRLQDEDIENVGNLASADLIDLFLNTRIAPNRIIDWIDQAILLSITFGMKVADRPLKEFLYTRGWRSITAIEATMNADLSLVDGEVDVGGGAVRSLITVLRTISEIADTNPNFALVQTWKGVNTPEIAYNSSTSVLMPNAT
jgi:hypothetical protein